MKYEKLAQTNRMQALKFIDEVSFLLHTSYFTLQRTLSHASSQTTTAVRNLISVLVYSGIQPSVVVK
jgi:hypothetical protein